MNDDNSYTIYCSRCGSEMKNTSRYCMKCGNLNPNSEYNQNMLKFIGDEKSTYVVGSGKNINEANNKVVDSIGTNRGNYNSCFIFNIVLYFISLFVALFFCYTNNMFSITYLSLIIFSISVCFMLLFSVELIFMKMNQKWWKAFIPIYNLMVISKSLLDSYFLGLLCIIPIVGQIIGIVLLYKLSKSFNKSFLLMFIVPFIMFMVIGYGSSLYNNINYSGDSISIEREYKIRHYFLSLNIVFIFLSLILFIISNYSHIKNINFHSIYLYNYSKNLVDDIKDKYDSLEYECSADSNIKYFYGADSTFFYDLDYYVKVVDDGVDKNYFISITNGEYGFDDVLIDDISLDLIDKYNGLSSYENRCIFK